MKLGKIEKYKLKILLTYKLCQNSMKKESILDEEAYIYNHRSDENESDKWKKMSRKQKFAYFNDYYRNKIIAAIIVLGFVFSVLYTMFSPKPEVVASVAVIND